MALVAISLSFKRSGSQVNCHIGYIHQGNVGDSADLGKMSTYWSLELLIKKIWYSMQYSRLIFFYHSMICTTLNPNSDFGLTHGATTYG